MKISLKKIGFKNLETDEIYYLGQQNEILVRVRR